MVAAGPASAGVTERITNYRSEVTIEHDGTIEVHETIAYDFGVVPHHGIFRDVPVRTDQSGKDGYDRVYPLDVVSVAASEGTPAQYTVEDQGDDQRIKIGDPDVTITGQHVYDITYRVRGAMNAFDDHDELVWNAVGPEWSVPIEQASAVVRAPADIQRVLCTTGPFGSFSPCGVGVVVRRRGDVRAGAARAVRRDDGQRRDPEGRGGAVADPDPGGAVQPRVRLPGDARDRRHLRRDPGALRGAGRPAGLEVRARPSLPRLRGRRCVWSR